MTLTESSLSGALGSRPFRFFPEAESTNDLAREWLIEGAPSGAVVFCNYQSAGRGRFGRVWNAPPDTALLMSVILRPHLSPNQLGRITMLGAVAVAETLAGLPSLPMELIGLKWPNDVQLAGRKVAGILSEGVWHDDQLMGVVLGIGINVRIDFSGSVLQDSATSIERVSGVRIDRSDLAAHLLRRIDHWTSRIADRSLLTAWRGRLTTIGQIVTVQTVEDGHSLSGTVVDVDDLGALLVKDPEGSVHRIVAGDVTLQG